VGEIHRETLGLKPTLKRRGQPYLVLHHQQPHT
jgi:hypothetical protein